VATPTYQFRVDSLVRARWQAAASERGLSLPAAIHEAMEEWMDGDELEGAEPHEKPAGPSAAAGLQRDLGPVAPVFAPAVELASVPPAEPEPGRPRVTSAEQMYVQPDGPRVDVSGLMQRRRDPVEKAKADLGKVLASPKVLRKPSARLEGQCVHGELYCPRCPGHH